MGGLGSQLCNHGSQTRRETTVETAGRRSRSKLWIDLWLVADHGRGKSRRRSRKHDRSGAISRFSASKSAAKSRSDVRKITVKQRRRPLEAPYLAGEMPKCRSIARILSNPVLEIKGAISRFANIKRNFRVCLGTTSQRPFPNTLCTKESCIRTICYARTIKYAQISIFSRLTTCVRRLASRIGTHRDSTNYAPGDKPDVTLDCLSRTMVCRTIIIQQTSRIV